MKVCFVNIPGYHFTNQDNTVPTGGGELSLYFLATAINPSFGPSMVVGDFGQPHIQHIGSVTFYSSIAHTTKRYVFHAIRLWRTLREAHADIYVASTFGKGIFFVWLFCAIHQKKFIYLTGNEHECDNKYHKIEPNPIIGYFFHIALTHANLIVASVAYHQKLLTTHHPHLTKKIVSIPYGAPIPTQNKNYEKKYILWLARCEPWKNPFIFIDLAKQFPDEQFVMVAAPQEQKLPFFEQVRSAALACPNITFIPGVPYQQSQQLFNNAKVSINTSDFEGFSMAFIQSGLGGTPIITTHLNPDTIITTQRLGFCTNGNINLMTDRLKTLLSDKRIWEEMSHNIATYMERNHNIHSIARRWEQLFTTLLNQEQDTKKSYIYNNFFKLLFRSIELDFTWITNPYVPIKWEFLLKKYLLLAFPYLYWDQKNQSYRMHTSCRDIYLETSIGIGSIQSTLTDYDYLVPLIKKNGVVVDAGGHIGEFSLVAELLLQATTIYSFEPIKKSFELLQKNTRSKAFHGAICLEKTRNIYIPEHSLMASGSKNFTASHHETVSCITPDTVPELLSEPIIHLFKIDVEGMEYDVLKTSKKILEKSQYIMMEVSIDRPSTESALNTLHLLRSIIPSVELIHVGKTFGDTIRTDSTDLLFKNTSLVT